MALNLERNISAAAIILALFLATNFSPRELGFIYLGMAVAYLIAVEGGLPQFPISKRAIDLSKIFLIAFSLIVIWFFLSAFVLNNFGFAVGYNPQAIFKLLASSTTPPLISKNIYLYFFTFGIFIPVVETLFFFGFILPWINSLMRMSKEANLVLSILVIGSIMALFHLVAAVFSDAALITDFIFAGISAYIVIYYRELSQAILFHVTANLSILFYLTGMIK